MTIVKKNIPVLEMSCAVCAANVENMVRSVEGVISATVNFASNQLYVEYDSARVTPLQLQQAVRSIGYDLIVDEDHAEEEQQQAQQNHYHQLKRTTLGAWCFALPLMILGMVFMHERDTAAIESIYFGANVRSAIPTAHARGAALVALSECALEIGEYTPMQIKQAVVGTGAADKRQVAYMVRTLTQLDHGPKKERRFDYEHGSNDR